jgi:hypothetical protein
LERQFYYKAIKQARRAAQSAATPPAASCPGKHRLAALGLGPVIDPGPERPNTTENYADLFLWQECRASRVALRVFVRQGH